jgi:hypothetical protein
LIGSNNWDNRRGRVIIHSGRNSELLHSWLDEDPTDQFGSTVSASGSPKQRLLVDGAMGAGAGGRVIRFRFFEKERRFVEHFRVEAEEKDGNFGRFFSLVIGNSNGDGIEDVYAVDFNAKAGGLNSGQVRVLSGADGKELWRREGQAGEGLGISKAIAGDVDGDGLADLVSGACKNFGAAVSGGDTTCCRARMVAFCVPGFAP